MSIFTRKNKSNIRTENAEMQNGKQHRIRTQRSIKALVCRKPPKSSKKIKKVSNKTFWNGTRSACSTNKPYKVYNVSGSSRKSERKTNTTSYDTGAFYAVATMNTTSMDSVKAAASDTFDKIKREGTEAVHKAHDAASNAQKKISIFETRDLFAPRTWAFWRSVIVYFFMFSLVGHWMELPYCTAMDSLFGIVADDYAVWLDPLFVPYWVYGIGSVFLTLLLLPMKNMLIRKTKNIVIAAAVFLIAAVLLAAVLETVIGLIINQPDALTGKYPFWDNSVLPLNILGQGWLVNDLALGFVSFAYVWLVHPVCEWIMGKIGNIKANMVFIGTVGLFGMICLASYLPMIFG